MSKWSDITASSYKMRDSRIGDIAKYNRDDKTATNYMMQFVSLYKDYMSGIAMDQAAIKAGGQQVTNKAAQNIAGMGVSQKSYDDFVGGKAKEMEEAAKLMSKNRVGSEKFEKGRALQMSVQNSIATAAKEKQMWIQHRESLQGVTLDNMSNTVSPEGSANTLDILNNKFIAKNEVYFTSEGYLVYDKKVEDNIIANKSVEQRVIDAGINPEFSGIHFTDQTTVSQQDPDIPSGRMYPEREHKWAGYTTEQLLDMERNNLGHSYTQIPITDGEGGELSASIYGGKYRLIHKQQTSIFDAPVGNMNTQGQEGSLQNSINSYNDLWEAKGTNPDHASGATAHSEDGTSNDDNVTEEIKHGVDQLLMVNSDEFQEWVFNGNIELADKEGKVTNTHPAAILLWQMGLQDHELKGDELKSAIAKWDNEETVDILLEMDPDKEGLKSEGGDGDDVLVSWNTREEYERWRRAYKVQELALAQQPVSPEQKDVLKEVLVENALMRNKQGHDKHTAAEQEKVDARYRLQPLEIRRQRERRNLDNKFLEEWTPIPGEPILKKPPTTIRQIEFFREISPQHREWADKKGLKYYAPGDLHPETQEKLEVGGYYYRHNPTLGTIVETVPAGVDANGNETEAYDITTGQWSLWNEGKTLNIHRSIQ